MTQSKLVPISVKYPTPDRLRAAKVGGESYDDVVNRLLDAYEAENGPEATA